MSIKEKAIAECFVRVPERISVPCPDGIKGCAVFHFKQTYRERTPLEIAEAIRALNDE